MDHGANSYSITHSSTLSAFYNMQKDKIFLTELASTKVQNPRRPLGIKSQLCHNSHVAVGPRQQVIRYSLRRWSEGECEKPNPLASRDKQMLIESVAEKVMVA